MCLYTRMVKNPKYLPNKKNKGKPPKCDDERKLYVPIGCGNCIECRKLRQREWRVRIHEEMKTDKTGKFITLTFSEEKMDELIEETGIKEANELATKAIRRFTERWRKEFGKTIKHWMIVELGHKGTERVHMHGILWTKENKKTIERIWKYGMIWEGYSMGEKAVNYILKYITKVDKDHKDFKGKILTSKGIGKKYTETINAKDNKRRMDDTYRLENGTKTKMPIYYRNKIFNEEDREKMWIDSIDKGIMWVNGIKIDVTTERGREHYEKMIMYERERTALLGMGTGEKTKKYFAKKTLINLGGKEKPLIFAKPERDKEKQNKLLKKIKKNENGKTNSKRNSTGSSK